MSKKTTKIYPSISIKPNNAAENTQENPLSFHNQYVLTAISMSKGLTGSKQIDADNIFHLEILKQISTHRPKVHIILVAGVLARWNYWEMINKIPAANSDEQLTQCLNDLPALLKAEQDKLQKENPTAELPKAEVILATLLARKFADLAKTSETNYTTSLKNYLEKNKNITGKIKYEIAGWEKRTSFENYNDTTLSPLPVDFSERLNATKEIFLSNKKTILQEAQQRLVKAQPLFANIDFEALTHEACSQYITEEYHYVNALKQTSILYPGKLTPAMEPIFDNNLQGTRWCVLSCKRAKTLAQQLHESTYATITRALSTSEIDRLNRKTKASSWAERRLKFPLSIKIEPEKTSPTPSPKENKKTSFSPKSAQRLMTTLFKYISDSPPSAEKQLAMQKIEEAYNIVTHPKT